MLPSKFWWLVNIASKRQMKRGFVFLLLRGFCSHFYIHRILAFLCHIFPPFSSLKKYVSLFDHKKTISEAFLSRYMFRALNLNCKLWVPCCRLNKCVWPKYLYLELQKSLFCWGIFMNFNDSQQQTQGCILCHNK